MTATKGWLFGIVGLGVGLLLGFSAGQNNVASTSSPLNPQQRALDANLWIQTSAEYRACCLTIFHCAFERLEMKKAVTMPGKLPFAVIMDLDETVFDNSPFQTFLSRNSLAYSDALWDEWEKDHANEVRTVPGALDFIRKAEAIGVSVVYISNRSEKYRSATLDAIKHLGMNRKDIEGRMWLATNSSDKTARRREVRERYNVLMLIGDNLRDLSEEFRANKVDPNDIVGLKKGIAERFERVDRNREKWGDEWIMLPNPVYGEWTKLAGATPLEVLNPSKMSTPNQ
jgi:acid phosphatase